MPPKKDKKAPVRSRGANWTEEETKTLIDVLRENFPDFRKGKILNYQAKEASFYKIFIHILAKRKNGVYEKMWNEMNGAEKLETN